MPRSFLCQHCGERPIAGARDPARPHPNARYCTPCREARRRQPRSCVTPAQAAQLRPLLGTMPVLQLCQQVGISKAAYQRWRLEEGMTLRNNAYHPETVEAVLRVYEQASRGKGKHAVREQFPDVTVRSIVERYRAYTPRQIRWTDAQVREAAKMAGLVSHTAQARWFSRPHAASGSLHSLWKKRFQCAPSDLNGFGVHRAGQLATLGCPAVLVQRLEAGAPIAKILCLDLARWLHPDVPDWVRDGVAALATFQAWLHGTDDPAAIRAMIQERETGYGDADPSDDERAGARGGGGDGDRERENDRANA